MTYDMEKYLEEVEQERDELRKALIELRKALIKYGRHDPRCFAKIISGECDCGFDDAVGCDE